MLERSSGETLKATHGSPDRPLRIGDLEIPCYVLENGMRVLSGRGMQSALALGQAHGALLKEFMGKDNLKPYINDDLAMALSKPVRFIRPGRGGKTGPGARPLHPDWAISVVRQCKAAGIPVFVKQIHINGKPSKNMSEWPEELRVRELPWVTP